MDGAVAYFVTVTGPPASGEACRRWFRAGPAPALAGLPGLAALDLYTPERARDPCLDEDPPPLVMAQLWFPSVGDLEAALAHPRFPAALLADGEGVAGEIAVSHDAMAARAFPVAGEAAPAPLAAPVSYVVRYHRPAPDEAAFVDFYLAHHPPILGRLPGIRNVLCYVPLAWEDPTGLPRADYLLGNEVVFDSLAELDAALASDVRHELRADFERFPPYSGRNTHWAMARTRLRPPSR